MAETMTWRRNRCGRNVEMIGKFLSSGTNVDINCSMRRVRYGGLQSQNDSDSEASLSRNNTTNTDGGTVYGTVHFEELAASRDYIVNLFGR